MKARLVVLIGFIFLASFYASAENARVTKDGWDSRDRITSYNVCYTKLLRVQLALLIQVFITGIF